MIQPALEVENLRLEIPTRRGVVHAVRGVSFAVMPGETFALVGESGSGKTMTCRSILRLLHPPARITGGAVRFQGRDLLRLSERALETVRGRGIAMVFQDPMTALNPVLTIERQIGEALTEVPPGPVFAALRSRAVGGRSGRAERRRRIVTLLRQVGIPDAERRLRAYPHQLSGGQRQRVMLAVVLARRPAVLLADEPTTALDVTIQAQILRLLASLQQQLGMALVLVTHDLGIVRQVVHRVAVMYAGQIVEMAPTAELFARPRHPYTEGLIASVPSVDRHRPLVPIPGMPPDIIGLADGCAFAPRCPLAVPECRRGEIVLRDIVPGRLSRCIRAEIVGTPVAV
ncbi:MAG TPA: ABC transporter ATP-binding protein [bacterium]|nr:ABC transporter ATP-binding protein [bacterium]